MSTVLAVSGYTSDDPDTTDTAAAVATLVNASVRTVELSAVREPIDRANRILAELADNDTVLGVIAESDARREQSWHILQHATKPVVLVPGGSRPEPRSISRALIPLDGTPESAAAVAETIRLLARAGVELIVLHVFDAATVPKFWDHPGHAEQAWQTEFLARYCSEPGVRMQLRSGIPGEHVLDVADTEGVDLIALGWSQQLDKGHARTLRHTLHDARVPVLVVPVSTPD